MTKEISNRMNILYVGDKYDYMKPKRGVSYGYTHMYETLRSMYGDVEVGYFPVDEIVQKEGRKRVNERLLEIANERNPKVIFFAVGGEIGDIFDRETLLALTNTGTTQTVIWMSDDQWAFETYSRHWASCFNWVVTTDPAAPPKYRKRGYHNILLSQWACNPRIYKPLGLPKIFDVSFVGSAHGNRKAQIGTIRKAGINAQCWGSGWPNGRVSLQDMVRIFSQSRICLNFTKSSGVLSKDLAYLLLRRRMRDRKVLLNSPARVLDSIKAFPACMWSNQIKGRNFEIPACASFCLTEYANGLEDYYEIGKEIECFSTPQEAAGKIAYYFAHEGEREAIAKAGWERTLRDHTWEKRFLEIFERMGLALSIQSL